MYHAGHEICGYMHNLGCNIVAYFYPLPSKYQNMPPYEKYLCASLMENKMPVKFYKFCLVRLKPTSN